MSWVHRRQPPPPQPQPMWGTAPGYGGPPPPAPGYGGPPPPGYGYPPAHYGSAPDQYAAVYPTPMPGPPAQHWAQPGPPPRPGFNPLAPPSANKRAWASPAPEALWPSTQLVAIVAMGPPPPPLAWPQPFGISNEPHNDCTNMACMMLFCDICCTDRTLYYRPVMGHNPHGEHAQVLTHGGSCLHCNWTHSGSAYGHKVDFEAVGETCTGLLPCCTEDETLLVRGDDGSKVGEIRSMAPCTSAMGCCCTVPELQTASAKNAAGELVFERHERVPCTTCTEAMCHSGGDCIECNCWQTAHSNVYAIGKNAWPGLMGQQPFRGNRRGVHVGTMYMRRHQCYCCYPSHVGFADAPLQTDPPLTLDEQRILLGMAHQWRWKVENYQRICFCCDCSIATCCGVWLCGGVVFAATAACLKSFGQCVSDCMGSVCRCCSDACDCLSRAYKCLSCGGDC